MADSGSTLENIVSFTPTMQYDGIVVRCSAKNPYWTSVKNTTFPLNVMYPPMPLVDSPIKIVVVEGESFKENLTVKANPPVSAWRWRKNGIPFEHTIGNVFARGSVLSGRSLTSQDAGQYTMFAINSVGNVNFTIHLIVEYSAKVKFNLRNLFLQPRISDYPNFVPGDCLRGRYSRPGMRSRWSSEEA